MNEVIGKDNSMDFNDNFSRKELQELARRALETAKESSNNIWARAYEDLAYSCCVLDAFMAKTETKL